MEVEEVAVVKQIHLTSDSITQIRHVSNYFVWLFL